MNPFTTKIEQTKTLFQQLRPLTAAKIALHEIARKAFNPDSLITYSQAGEDRLIEYLLYKVFKQRRYGFYVDVGSNHPFSKSNTMRLYLRGWRGIAVEANPRLAAAYRKCRIRDQVVCAAASDVSGNEEFIIATDSALSALVSSTDDSAPTGHQIIVKARPLCSILREFDVPRKFELLSIDVEGAEYRVLQSLDFSQYRPQLIVVEMHRFDLSHPKKNRVYSYLEEVGYWMHSYAGMNGYFIENGYPLH